MFDPFNVLPVDPEWVRKFDTASAQAVALLDCMVVIIALQENGKIALSIDGTPDDGPLADFAKDVPQMLVVLANLLAMQHKRGRENLDS